LFDISMASMSYLWNVDLAQFDPDVPLSADMMTEGHQSALAHLISTGRSLRDLFGTPGIKYVYSLVGSPDTVAAKMGETMEEVGGDGLVIAPQWWLTRRYISEVVDGLVPALQRRGLTQTEYQYDMFIDNLRAF
jgi:alkanesulfonate monooxygenase SsuD/methylene tetrahydromethanopterin reductase-like flavin-dependent oxidoreductase (luciferase family)